jgi:hypothetical protein
MKISYKFPNPLFIIWVAIFFFIVYFFYDSGNALQNFTPHIFAYICYVLALISIMLGALPYLLGLSIDMQWKLGETKVTEQPADDTPVGLDYFIPIWGYLRYQMPNLIKKKKSIVLIENVALYFTVGIINGVFRYNLSVLYIVALIIAIIAEWYLYYKNWLPFMKKGIDSKTRGIAYLTIQEHALAWMALGWIIGAFLILH